MSKKISYICSEEDAGERLDVFISSEEESVSRNCIQNMIKNGNIQVNGKFEKASYIMTAGDVVNAEFVDKKEIFILPEDITLDIRYEDDFMLVVNKPAGMITHPTEKERTGSLVNALLGKYRYEGLSSINGNLRPGILHRLDRNTSGLLMIAKTDASHEYLASLIKNHKVEKKYLTIVSGNFTEDIGTIDAPIARSKTDREKFTISPEGKPSVTHYRVLERFGDFTFLEVTLETGRTHQIRVHLASTGHPVVNDSLYGGKNIKVNTVEQVLQAYKLRFIPFKQADVIDIELCPDDYITKTLKKLRMKR